MWHPILLLNTIYVLFCARIEYSLGPSISESVDADQSARAQTDQRALVVYAVF